MAIGPVNRIKSRTLHVYIDRRGVRSTPKFIRLSSRISKNGLNSGKNDSMWSFRIQSEVRCKAICRPLVEITIPRTPGAKRIRRNPSLDDSHERLLLGLNCFIESAAGRGTHRRKQRAHVAISRSEDVGLPDPSKALHDLRSSFRNPSLGTRRLPHLQRCADRRDRVNQASRCCPIF
jgi:hypothetical protein